MQTLSVAIISIRAAERIGEGGPRANTKSGALQNGLCEGGLGTCPQEIFAILHALKCVLGTPEALFRACTQYIYSVYLQVAVFD